MAHYDYRCLDCGVVFEANLPIDDRNLPTEEPCDKCHGTVERIPAAPGVSYTYGGAKTPDSFKDVLRKIKSKHRHSTINV